MKQLVKKIKINTTITLLTGLHIGGSKENVEIGGIDNPVIKLASKKDQPYIPGSSLKGKMRCLLEQVEGAAKIGQSCKVNKLFGAIENKKENIESQLSRLIVRDACLTKDSANNIKECDSLDMPFTECKFENTIDRTTGTTVKGGVRQTERVPAGAEFDVQFIVNIWNDDDETELLNMLKQGISLIENDYIGGSGSRGYGQVRFGEPKATELTAKNNWNPTPYEQLIW